MTEVTDGSISFDNVDFSYTDENGDKTHVLKDITLDIKSGEVIGILAGPNPEEVRSGLDVVVYEIENGASFYSANDDDSIPYFAHCISRAGTYLSEGANAQEGTAIAYLIAPPAEAMVGLDAALKAADVTVGAFYGPPSETNFAGGLLTGSQSACRAACDAFARTVISIADNPQNY